MTARAFMNWPCGAHCALSGLLLLVLVGCSDGPPTLATPPSTSPLAESDWRQARTAWLLEHHEDAQHLFSRFAERHRTDPRRQEALLSAGICAQHRGRPQEAAEFLNEVVLMEGALAARALLQLGYLELSEDPQAAVLRFQSASERAADPETRAEAFLEAGIALQRCGRFEEAAVSLEACVHLGEASGLADRARLQLGYDPWFTVQAGAFLQRSNAEGLSRSLVNAGFPAEIRAPGRRGSPLYYVTSGRFGRRSDAQAHAREVQLRLGGDAPLVRP